MSLRRISGLTNPGGDVERVREMRFPAPGAVGPMSPVDRGPQMPPSIGNSSEGAFSRSVKPPWVEKIGPVSRDFFVADYNMTLAAVAGASVTSASLIFTLPANQVGWLQQLSMYILSPTANSQVLFTVRINGGPVAGFTRVPVFPGAANFEVIDVNDMQVRIPAGGTVDVIIENNNASGPWTVGGKLGGWYHPQDAELKYWGEV